MSDRQVPDLTRQPHRSGEQPSSAAEAGEEGHPASVAESGGGGNSIGRGDYRNAHGRLATHFSSIQFWHSRIICYPVHDGRLKASFICVSGWVWTRCPRIKWKGQI